MARRKDGGTLAISILERIQFFVMSLVHYSHTRPDAFFFVFPFLYFRRRFAIRDTRVLSFRRIFLETIVLSLISIYHR